jgi:hypothetical protein
MRVKFEWRLSVNMSVSEISVNKAEIRGVIQCKYVCRWDKGE